MPCVRQSLDISVTQSPKLLEAEMDVNFLFMDGFGFQLLRNLAGGNAALCS